jgi:hypothetical protein
MNQMGATSGLPSWPVKASLPVRVPALRKALISGSVTDAARSVYEAAAGGRPPGLTCSAR